MVRRPAPSSHQIRGQIALNGRLQPGLRHSEREQQEQGKQRETAEENPARVCEHSLDQCQHKNPYLQSEHKPPTPARSAEKERDGPEKVERSDRVELNRKTCLLCGLS